MIELSSYGFMIFQGILVTIVAWFCSALLSFTCGITLGFLATNRISPLWVQYLLRTYAFIAKGIPAYVQILIAYFVVPAFFGISIPGFLAAVCALAFCSSGYVFEIVRAGVNTISEGQWDACYVLGFSKKDTILHIIAPQVATSMLPAFIGELEQLLKSTSLFATIGITELTRTGMNIISRELNPISVYTLIAAIYLTFSFGLFLISLLAEKKRKNVRDTP